MDRFLLGKFMEHGIMVAPEIADQLTEDDYRKTLAEQGVTILTAEKLAELRNRRAPKTELTAGDFVGYYRNKIMTLTPFLLSRVGEQPVSINKMRPGRNTVIGIVREPRENGFYLEDLTGGCAVVSETPDVLENDVVAVSGTLSGDRFAADDVVYPELPVKKNVKRTTQPGKIFFGAVSGNAEQSISKLPTDGGTETFALIIEIVGESGRLVSVRIKNGVAETRSGALRPAKMFFGQEDEKLKIQLLFGAVSSSVETAARSVSKRRCGADDPLSLPQEKEGYIDEDADIIFLGKSAESGFVNHKGYTFVAVGDNFVGMDTQTRAAWVADF